MHKISVISTGQRFIFFELDKQPPRLEQISIAKEVMEVILI